MGIEDHITVGQAHYTDAAWEKNTPKTIVHFHYKPRLNKFKSDAAGEPVYDQVVFVKKITPGDNLLSYDQPATEKDKEEHAAEYEAFIQKRSMQQTGIPLEKWDGLTDDQIPAFKALNIYTVEHLASLPDSAGSKLFGFIKIRQKARDFLEARSKHGAAEAVKAELEARDKQIAELQAQMQALLAKKKPGRPRKGQPAA